MNPNNNPISKIERWYKIVTNTKEVYKDVQNLNNKYFARLSCEDAINIREGIGTRYDSKNLKEIEKSFEKMGFIINYNFQFWISELSKLLLELKNNKEMELNIRKYAFLIDTPDDFNITLAIHYRSFDIYQMMEWPEDYPEYSSFYLKASMKDFLTNRGFIIVLI